MKIKEIINKAKKEIEKYENYIICGNKNKTLTNLSKSFVCILHNEFCCSTWNDIYCFIKKNTTFEFNSSKTIQDNINDFIKSYNTQLEVE